MYKDVIIREINNQTRKNLLYDYRMSNNPPGSVSIVPPPGSIMAYLGTSDPDGWLICDGRLIIRTTYPKLFDVVGPNIPNLQNQFLMGSSGTFNIKSIGGNSSVTLSANNLPAHNHSLTGGTALTNIGGSPSYLIVTDDGYDGGNQYPGFNYNHGGAHTISTATLGRTDNNTTTTTAINILPPYYTVNYIIKY